MPPELLALVTTPEQAWSVELPGRARRRLPIEVWLLTLVALAVYAAATAWIIGSLHYEIGDALARTANARAMVAGRDPHLAALGLVWLPLPTLIQLPFVVPLGLLGHAQLAGPVSTVVCTAASVPVVASIARRLGLSRPVVLALTACYALNPVVVFYAASGMSEAAFFLFGAVALLGFVGWRRDRRVQDLVVLGLGLAGAGLVRYEALGFVLVLAGAAAWDRRNLRRTARTALVVAAPAAAVFILWLATSWLVKGDPLWWAKASRTTASPPAGAPWLPDVARHPLSALTFVGRWTWLTAPGLALAAVAAVTRARGRAVTLAGVALAGIVFPATVALLLLRNGTWGDPRYFAPLCLFAVVAAAVAASPSRATAARVWNGALVLALVAGAVTAAWSRADATATTPEGEDIVFARLVGRTPAPRQAADVVDQWRDLTKKLDAAMRPGDRVLADSTLSFPIIVFTQHPKALIVPGDRDFDRTLAEPEGAVDLAVEPNRAADRGLSSAGGDAVSELLSLIPARDKQLVVETPVARVYRLRWPDAPRRS